MLEDKINDAEYDSGIKQGRLSIMENGEYYFIS